MMGLSGHEDRETFDWRQGRGASTEVPIAMPSISPFVPPAPPERLTRAQRRERRRRADEAGRSPRQAWTPTDGGGLNLPAGNPAQRAFEERLVAASLARGAAAFDLALAEPCHAHRAHPSQPCYAHPRGVCGQRVSVALNRVRPQGPPPIAGRPPRPFVSSRPSEPGPLPMLSEAAVR